MIAGIIGRSEFKTFDNTGKEYKGLNYYTLNINPNQNQTKFEFMTKLVNMLLTKNEVLIIQVRAQNRDGTTNNQRPYVLFIADSYTTNTNSMFGDWYSNVVVGNFSYDRSFNQDEVIFLRLNNSNIKKYLDVVNASWGSLLDYSHNAFMKSKGRRGTFKVDSRPTGTPEVVKAFNDSVEKVLRTLIHEDTGVVTLTNGQEYKELGDKTYSSESTRDMRNLADDIFTMAALAVGIPPVLLLGKLANTEKAFELLLSGIVATIAELISQGFTKKLVEAPDYLKGAKFELYTKNAKLTDIFAISANVDKLISSGVFSVNRILKEIGEPQIDEEWANRHYITKNYEDINNNMSDQQQQKGGI